MGFICGILGRSDAGVVRTMANAMAGRGETVHHAEGAGHSVASSYTIAPGMAVVDGPGAACAPADLLVSCRSAAGPSELKVTGPMAAAVCVEDGRKWWLMRDRLGRRPLYFHAGGDFFIFASELKALLASGLVGRHINLASVDRYLTLRFVPGPETILQDIRRVGPGCIVEYAAGKATEHRVWGFDLEPSHMRRDTAANQVRERLEESVAGCESDQILWSGGIDSAALGALRAGAKPVFAALERAWQSEANAARDSARKLNLALVRETADRLSEDDISRAVRALDEPLADASVLPLWLVMGAAAKHGRTFMCGHGADELLGGYPRYHFLQRAQGAKALVPVNLLSGISPSLPPNALIRRGSMYLSSIRANPQAFLSLLSVFEDDERESLYTDAMKSALRDEGGWRAVVKEHFTHRELARDVLSLDLNVSLPDHLLTKCDRLAAAHGITLEYPYLDDRMVDFVSKLPTKTKFGVRSKPLLRLAMRDILPGRVRLRARRGFQIPQNGRLVGMIESYARRTLTRDRVEASGLFKWPHVEHILHSSTHNVYRRRQYWALLMFFAWYREFMET